PSPATRVSGHELFVSGGAGHRGARGRPRRGAFPPSRTGPGGDVPRSVPGAGGARHRQAARAARGPRPPGAARPVDPGARLVGREPPDAVLAPLGDRKSTRLNSSHVKISYAVFC